MAGWREAQSPLWPSTRSAGDSGTVPPSPLPSPIILLPAGKIAAWDAEVTASRVSFQHHFPPFTPSTYLFSHRFVADNPCGVRKGV